MTMLCLLVLVMYCCALHCPSVLMNFIIILYPIITDDMICYFALQEEEKKDTESWQSKLHKKSKEYRSGGTLRDYQLEGLNWLLKCWYQKRSSILAGNIALPSISIYCAYAPYLCSR